MRLSAIIRAKPVAPVRIRWMMTTTTIESYLLIDGVFIPISQFSGELSDIDYVEGAIVWTIDGHGLLQQKHWDLIDQLWAYMIEGVKTLDLTDECDVGFPDQSLALRFKTISPRLVQVTVGPTSTIVDRVAFRSSLRRGALEFFSKMKAIAPESTDTWDRYEKAARSI